MSYDTIIYEVADRTATITFNRPEVLNAVSLHMEGELRDAYARAEADDDVWTVLVTANGRAFCSGADVEGVPADGLKIGTDIETGAAADAVQRLVQHRIFAHRAASVVDEDQVELPPFGGPARWNKRGRLQRRVEDAHVRC